MEYWAIDGRYSGGRWPREVICNRIPREVPAAVRREIFLIYFDCLGFAWRKVVKDSSCALWSLDSTRSRMLESYARQQDIRNSLQSLVRRVTSDKTHFGLGFHRDRNCGDVSRWGTDCKHSIQKTLNLELLSNGTEVTNAKSAGKRNTSTHASNTGTQVRPNNTRMTKAQTHHKFCVFGCADINSPLSLRAEDGENNICH